MQHRTKAPCGYSACRVSLIDSDQLLRQLTSCIRVASPYLYPAKDNCRSWWHTFPSHHGYKEYPYPSPYLAQTTSSLACKTRKPRENHTPLHFPMHIIAETHMSSQFLLFDCLTNSTNQNISICQANALQKFPSSHNKLKPSIINTWGDTYLSST